MKWIARNMTQPTSKIPAFRKQNAEGNESWETLYNSVEMGQTENIKINYYHLVSCFLHMKGRMASRMARRPYTAPSSVWSTTPATRDLREGKFINFSTLLPLIPVDNVANSSL